MSAPRVDVFIDGFNFYYGLRAANLNHYKWLNYVEMARRLNTTRRLGTVHYFTARVTDDEEAAARQSIYLEALEACCGSALNIVYGRMQLESKKCKLCGKPSNLPIEKHSDVNLATAMVNGAWKGEFDVAMLISGDADQAAAVQAVVDRGLEVRVVFPFERRSGYLASIATTSYEIQERFVRQSQLPDEITSKHGVLLRRPEKWQASGVARANSDEPCCQGEARPGG